MPLNCNSKVADCVASRSAYLVSILRTATLLHGMLFSAPLVSGRCADGSDPKASAVFHLISLSSSHPINLRITNRHVAYNRRLSPFTHSQKTLTPQEPRLKGSQPPARPDPHPLFQILSSGTVLSSHRGKGCAMCCIAVAEAITRTSLKLSLATPPLRPPCQQGRKNTIGGQQGETLVAFALPQRLIPTNERT